MNRFLVQYLPASLLLLTLPSQLLGQAPQVPTSLTGPVPSQITSAHNVFLANTGADPNFPLDSTRVYNDIYAALKTWGHFQLVTAPAQADLVFQLHEIDPITNVAGGRGGVYTYTSPAFQLTILDPKTNVTLWTITSPVTLAGRREVFEHWVALSEANLISRIQVVSGQPLSAEQTADLTTVPKSHHARNVALLVGGVAALGVASALIIHHEYENSLSNQKASQDAFCIANNIPLSMCVGG